MKIVVTGATGHIGSYLVPLLVRAGHDVVAVSRGRRLPFYPGMTKYQKIPSKKGFDIIPAADGDIENAEYKKIWDAVEQVSADRLEMEKQGTFGSFVMSFAPDTICDLLCYTPEQARQIAKAAMGKVAHLVHVGTVWVFGYNITVPVDENHPRTGFGEYGENKIACESYLMELSRLGKLPVSIVHPGHIVGEGWIPLNPQGNFSLDIFEKIKSGQQIILPQHGTQTVHHVHAEDVSRLVAECLGQPDKAVSQAFISTSERAVTARGFAEETYKHYGHEPNIDYVLYEKFLDALAPHGASQSDEHLSRCPCASMDKARELLGYRPKYSSLEAVFSSLDSLEKMGIL